MKKIFALISTAAVLSVGTAVCASAETYYNVTVSGRQNYDSAYKALDLINNDRASKGLPKLTMDKGLMDIATQRAYESVVLFDHKRPDGRGCFDGFSYSGSFGENLAWGQTSAQSVQRAWHNSSAHYTNYMRREYKSTGLACITSGGTTYWVQVFDAGSPDKLSKPANKSATKTVRIGSSLKSKFVPDSTPSLKTVSVQKISWSASAKATGYTIYKYDSSSKTYKAVKSTSSTSWKDPSYKGGVKYAVKAYRQNGDVIGFTSLSSGKSGASAVAKTSFTSASSTKNSVTLKWSRVPCSGYRIYKLDPRTKKYTYVKKASASATSCTVTGLSSKKSYSFKIRAYKTASDGTQFGEYSSVKTVKTK